MIDMRPWSCTAHSPISLAHTVLCSDSVFPCRRNNAPRQSQNSSPPSSLRGRCRNSSALSPAPSGEPWDNNWQNSKIGQSAQPNTPWAGRFSLSLTE